MARHSSKTVSQKAQRNLPRNQSNPKQRQLNAFQHKLETILQNNIQSFEAKNSRETSAKAETSIDAALKKTKACMLSNKRCKRSFESTNWDKDATAALKKLK
jgi:hypothetical protein